MDRSAVHAPVPLRRITWVSACLLALHPLLGANAQTPADDFTRRQAEQEQAERLERLRKITPDAGARRGPEAAPEQAAVGPCFPVERIAVDGARQFSVGAVARVVAHYQGKCVGLAEINALLKELTYLYLDEGFITSRAYVPEQDIAKTKVLRIVVVEGLLSDIYLNGKPTTSSGVIATAFPGLKEKIVNIRDIEQGLDQINRLSSNHATTVMLPGADNDTSILNVENAPVAPWHLSLSNDNLGEEQTGYSRSSVSFQMDNMIGLNDLWFFTYERTGPDYPGDGDGIGKSDSFSGGVNVPYGYWTFQANGSWYGYDSSVPGNFGDIDTSGDSRQVDVGADRVVHRDKDSITTINATLAYKETNNFLLGNRIEVGSRHYTVGSIGISHSRRMLGGLWVFDAAFDQGLDLFGAVDADDPGAAGVDPRFSKFTGTISASIPFELAKQRFQFSSLLSGQYSPDSLFGAEQIALGGYSNVRGTRESLLFGNSGLFTRNELVWRSLPWLGSEAATAWLGELSPYVGLDYGRVFSQARYDIEGDDIAGWTVGARLVGGKLNLDVGYSDILAASVEVPDCGLFYFSTSVRW